MNDVETWGVALAGGALLGVSMSVMLAVEGRAEGVSGMLAGLRSGSAEDRAYRAWFLGGLATAGACWYALDAATFADDSGRALPWFAIGGLLIGYGARLASGCTSGHGIFGVARASPRSLWAVTLFMVAASITVLLYPLAPSAASLARLETARPPVVAEPGVRVVSNCAGAWNGGAP